MAETLDLVLRAQNQASAALNSVRSSLDQLNDDTKRAGAALSLGVTAPFALFAKQGLSTMAEFSRTLAELEVVTGATGDSMTTLTDTAIRLGAETSFSANEAATAMLELSKAGMDTEDVLASIPGVLSLAAAGGVDLAYAANLTASSLNAFQMEANQAGYVSNLLAAAANESSANISDLAYGLQQGGFAFNAAGQDVDDLAASLAILTNVGLTGSDAGTALKNAFTRLMSPTDDAAKLMASLNLRFYDAQGTMLPLADIIGILNDKLGGMTDEQRNAALVTLFLNDGMKAMIPLMDLGKDGFLEMKDAVNQVGVAQKVADAKMRGLAGAFEYASGSIESAMLNVWRPFEATIADVVRRGADLVTWLSNLPRPIINAALAFTAVLAAAGPLLLIIPQIIAFIAAMGSGVGLVVLAVAALAAAWASNFGNIQGITFAAVDAIVGFVRQLWTAITTGDFGPLLDSLTQAWDSIKTWTVNVYNTLLENVPLWAAAVASWATNAWTTAETSLTTYVESVKTWISTQVPLITEKVLAWATAFAAWATNAWTTVSPILATFWESLTTWISTQKDTLPEKLTAWVTEFAAWANDIWTTLSTNLGTMWTSLSGWISAQVDVLYPLLYKWAVEFGTWAADAWAELSPKLAEFWGKVQNWITLKALELKQKVKSWADSFIEFPDGLTTTIGVLQSLWDEVTPVIENHVQRFKDAFASLQESLGPLQEAFGRLFDALKPWFVGLGVIVGVVLVAIGAAISVLLTLIENVIAEIGPLFTAIIDALATQVETINSTFQSMVDFVTSLIDGDWAGAWESAKQIFWNFGTTISTFTTLLWAVMSSAFTIIKNTVIGILDDLGMDGQQIMLDMRTAIRMTFMQMRLDLQSKMTEIKTSIIADFFMIKSSIEEAISAAKEAVVNKFNDIKTGAESAIDSLRSAVETKFNGIKTWIAGLTFTNPFSQVMSWAEGAINAVNNALGAIGKATGVGGGSTNKASGTAYWRGGPVTLNERGTELIALPGRNRQTWLPRGSRIIPAEQVPLMAGGGGVTVVLNATVTGEADEERLAWRVASIIRRNS